MSEKERVLKFGVDDDHSRYVLVNVRSRGSKPLDVKIQATEGDAEYSVNLKHDKVGSLKVKNCPASDSEWQKILEDLFNQEPLPDIQTTATVSTDSSIALVVRKSIQGITQRLGEITISAVPGGELNVLDWCATAADATAKCKEAVADSSNQVAQLQNEVKALTSQLEELIKAKEEDETTLLMKFRDLLNEKKVKIRQQQEIIASSTTNPNKTTSQDNDAEAPSPQPMEPARAAGKRKAQSSKPAKRKATRPADDESSDDGFEPVEEPKVKSEPEETDREQETDGTASTASDDEGEQAPAEPEKPTETSTSEAAPTKAPAKKAPAQPPPKRSLPFAKSKPKEAPAPAPTGADSETESDDEL